MKKLISLFVLFLFIIINSAYSQENIITISDFTPILGGSWKGNLTYIDYTSGKPTTIPAELSVSQVNDTSLELYISFPDEPQANSSDTIHILNGGKYLDDKKIFSVERSEGITTITAINSGTRNDTPATFQYVYTISSIKFTISKSYRTEDSMNFTLNNKYIFSK